MYRVIILYVCNKRQKNTLYATKVIQHYEFSLVCNKFLEIFISISFLVIEVPQCKIINDYLCLYLIPGNVVVS